MNYAYMQQSGQNIAQQNQRDRGNSKIQYILRASGKNAEMLRVSDLVTNGSRE